jgi:hypothetical protein
MMRSIYLVIALSFVASVALAQGQFRPHSTAEERACRGDARRFCKDEIPDQFRVASCLQMHRGNLSRACRSVLQNHRM